jgi:hypothetical protein
VAHQTPPTLKLERILFLDKKNWEFLDGSSPRTAAEREARWDFWVFFVISLIFCVPLTLLSLGSATLAGRLGKMVKRTTGVVLQQNVATGPEDTVCSVRYKFYTASSVYYEKEMEVSNEICGQLAEGRNVEVWYDPRDPSVSTLAVAAKTPKYSLWLELVCVLAGVSVTSWAVSKLRREKALASQGVILEGKVIDTTYGDELEIRYTFRAPDGSAVEAVARGRRNASNVPDPEPPLIGRRYDSVAVLYLSETTFGIL